MAGNLLENAGFEADWGEQNSHLAIAIQPDGTRQARTIGEIFTPPGWITWFRHDPGRWDQPEVRDSWATGDPVRVHSGRKAQMLFTFYRNHDAGFAQGVDVAAGTRLRLTAWAHAWSNHGLAGHEECEDDPRCSCGVGREPFAGLEGTVAKPTGVDPWADAVSNFVFRVGIDPTGGQDPYADTVVWGQGLHAYNAHAQVPAVHVEAVESHVTVFLRSTTRWAFKHNDAYWEDAELVVDEEPIWYPHPPMPRGLPRVQYPRTYILLPPGAGHQWAVAIAEACWDRYRPTIGASADDAGIGDLNVRRVLAVNAGGWPSDLRAFFADHYPDVEYHEVYGDIEAVGAGVARMLARLDAP